MAPGVVRTLGAQRARAAAHRRRAVPEHAVRAVLLALEEVADVAPGEGIDLDRLQWRQQAVAPVAIREVGPHVEARDGRTQPQRVPRKRGTTKRRARARVYDRRA